MTKKNDVALDKVVHAVKASRVATGDVMTFVYYARVVNKSGSDLHVIDLDAKLDFTVQGKELIERSFSADFFEEEIKVTKTKAAEILVSSHNRPLTVCFEKSNGDERTLRGRLVTPEPLLGRSMCEDLDVQDNSNRLRLVDHRTIKWLIVEGTKYVVK